MTVRVFEAEVTAFDAAVRAVAAVEATTAVDAKVEARATNVALATVAVEVALASCVCKVEFC